jgi:1-acyl-sn-glycerol-3-phosphate acyltransferase
MHYLPYAGGVLALIFACFALYVVRRYFFWRSEGRKYATDPAYVPPSANALERFFRMLAGRFAAFVYLGPVRVKNAHYLKDPRRLLILPNHQTERDAVVVPRIINLLHIRFLMAKTQVTASRAPWVAFTGGISVDHAGSPGSVVKTASRALAADKESSFVVFPEGELMRLEEMQRQKFHDGAIVIGRLAERLSDTTFAAMPVYIRYERDIRKAGYLQRTLLFLGLRRWRYFYGEMTYGVDVYFGKPIALSELPENKSEATTQIFEAIVALKNAANK